MAASSAMESKLYEVELEEQKVEMNFGGDSPPPQYTVAEKAKEEEAGVTMM